MNMNSRFIPAFEEFSQPTSTCVVASSCQLKMKPLNVINIIVMFRFCNDNNALRVTCTHQK